MNYVGKLALVKWRDACTVYGWTDAQVFQQKRTPPTCHTVGYILNIHDECLSIAHQIDTQNDNAGEVTDIPLSQIIEMHTLKVGAKIKPPKPQPKRGMILRSSKGGS